jgi:hypothetical protein
VPVAVAPTVPVTAVLSENVLFAVGTTVATCPAVRVPIVATAKVAVPLKKFRTVVVEIGAVRTVTLTVLIAVRRRNVGKKPAVKATASDPVPDPTDAVNVLAHGMRARMLN